MSVTNQSAVKQMVKTIEQLRKENGQLRKENGQLQASIESLEIFFELPTTRGGK